MISGRRGEPSSAINTDTLQARFWSAIDRRSLNNSAGRLYAGMQIVRAGFASCPNLSMVPRPDCLADRRLKSCSFALHAAKILHYLHRCLTHGASSIFREKPQHAVSEL